MRIFRMNGKYTCSLAFLTLISGCLFNKEEKHAGAQDFPNTLETMVAMAKRSVDSSGHWESVDDMKRAPAELLPDTVPSLPSLHNNLAKQRAVGKRVLGKRALNKSGNEPGIYDSIRIDSVTDGVTRLIYNHRRFLGFSAKDTLRVFDDSTVFDAIRKNEKVLSVKGRTLLVGSGFEYLYSILDKDSNGVFDHRRIEWMLGEKPDGARPRWVIYDAPGPDGNFDSTQDNLWYRLDMMNAKGSDTLNAQMYIDRDGDGVLFPSKNSGKQELEVNFLAKGDSAKPFVKRDFWSFRFFSDPQSTTRNFVVNRFAKETKFVNDQMTRFSIRGSGPDSTFAPGDTIWLTWEQSFAEPDTVSKARMVFSVWLSPNKLEAPDQLLSFSGKFDLRKGSLQFTEFQFIPDLPVNKGQDVNSGLLTVLGSRVAAKGHDSLVIQVKPSGWQGDFYSVEGESYPLKWNDLGELEQ